MKKTTISLFFLICTTVVITGCSSGKQAVRNRQLAETNQNAGDRQLQGRNQNLTEEERQKMISERQQLAIEACQEKNEGDSCQIETPRGEMSGVCNIIEENLVCTTDRPMGQRRE